MTLSPAELKITQAEYDALIWVRNGLAKGRFTHEPEATESTEYPLTIRAFHMGYIGEHGCGTAACIGGWVVRAPLPTAGEAVPENYMADNLFSSSIEPLFYPAANLLYSQITPTQAAQACDNFLITGKPNWEEIL